MRRRARPTVALVAQAGDLQARAVGAVLHALGCRVVNLDLGALDHGAPLTLLSPGTHTFLGVDLSGVGAAYVRSVPVAWPPVASQDGRPMLLKKWLAPWMLAKEREAAAMSLLLGWHTAGVPMLNPPGVHGFAQSKPHQLTLARRCGLPTPRTCITNDPQAARRFCRSVQRAVAKPLTGGALTRAVDPSVDFSSIAAAPVILQQRVDGQDVRLMVLQGRVLSCRAVTLPEGPVLDFRGCRAYQNGEAHYSPVDLPAALLKKVTTWVDACGLVFAGVDLKRTARGKWYALEANSSPIYLDQELKSGDPITAWLAQWLDERAKLGP